MAKKAYYMAAGVAQRLGLHRQTIYDAIERGSLRPVAFANGGATANHPLFDDAAIDRYRQMSLGKRSSKTGGPGESAAGA